VKWSLTTLISHPNSALFFLKVETIALTELRLSVGSNTILEPIDVKSLSGYVPVYCLFDILLMFLKCKYINTLLSAKYAEQYYKNPTGKNHPRNQYPAAADPENWMTSSDKE
jgi:hypothetical protein